MADDDRSAKAARAKALLKKRQQKKVETADHPSPADISSPISPTKDHLPVATSNPNKFGVLASNNVLDAATHESASHNDANVSTWRVSQTRDPEHLDALQPELEVEAGSGQIGLPVEKRALRGQIIEKDRELQASRDANDNLHMSMTDFGQLQHMQDVQFREQRADQDAALALSLKNAKNRADELEFQLSKLQDTHNQYEIEYEKLKAELSLQKQSYDELLQKDDDLQLQHRALQQQLVSTRSDIHLMTDEKSALQDQLISSQTTTSEMRQELLRMQSGLDSNSQNLDSTKNALATAIKRAEEAERALQIESRNLLQSVEEMRPNIVELTNTKLDLNEQIGGLKTQLKNRNDTIAELEIVLTELQISMENFTHLIQESDEMRQKSELPYGETASELQRILIETRIRIKGTAASLNELRNELISSMQTIQQQKGDFSNLIVAGREHLDELKALRDRLDIQHTDNRKDQELLREAQVELESLRAEFLLKDNEILQLRNTETNKLSHTSALDEEVINAMKQQHDLEISSARTQIRSLESSLFEAEGKNHTMQNRISILQDEADRLRKNIHQRQSFDENNRRPYGLLSVPDQHSKRTNFDNNLPSKVRHQRQVSLSMLKARLHSEVEVAAARGKTFSSALPSGHVRSPLISETIAEVSINDAGHDNPIIRRFQALDETHVFWCSSCKGDLIVL